MDNIYDKIRLTPFGLKEDDIDWIKKVLADMSLEEKVGQLFCLIVREGTEKEIRDTLKVMSPGGFMYRQMSLENAVKCTGIIKKYSKIPMLIAANLEKGGNGIIKEGTIFQSPMGIAAADNEENAYRLGIVCGKEGSAAGANWAFAPIVDIDNNFRNPITNTRTYGSDTERVKKMGRAYTKAVQECGVAACLKHFPGDGCDERDQHLVTSVNSMSCEEWDKTYGEVYRAGIEAGAMTVMCGHIMQPAWTRRLNPDIKEEEILPASLSDEIMNKLLRGRLKFNGLIVTDATTMAGYTIPMPRKKAVPYTIAAGADMFLFTKNMEEDYTYMLDGAREGVISPERLNEAVIRILALKTALGLHKPGKEVTIESARAAVGLPEYKEWANECIDRSITLVKEEKGVLPLSVEKYPRILYYPIENEGSISSYGGKAGACRHFLEMLRDEGFQVDEFVPENFLEGHVRPTRETEEKYDAILYLANLSTKSNQTTVRIEWQQPMGANAPHFIESIPTIFISVENPYHLLDVPRVKTYINAYHSSDAVLTGLMDKLLGRSEFCGINPVDPFCGKWDTRL